MNLRHRWFAALLVAAVLTLGASTLSAQGPGFNCPTLSVMNNSSCSVEFAYRNIIGPPVITGNFTVASGATVVGGWMGSHLLVVKLNGAFQVLNAGACITGRTDQFCCVTVCFIPQLCRVTISDALPFECQ